MISCLAAEEIRDYFLSWILWLALSCKRSHVGVQSQREARREQRRVLPHYRNWLLTSTTPGLFGPVTDFSLVFCWQFLRHPVWQNGDIFYLITDLSQWLRCTPTIFAEDLSRYLCDLDQLLSNPQWTCPCLIFWTWALSEHDHDAYYEPVDGNEIAFKKSRQYAIPSLRVH